MRLVPQCLQHFQRRTVPVKNNRFTASRQIDLLIPFRKTDNGKRRTVDRDQSLQSQMKLPFSTVHHQQIGKRAFLFKQT